MLDSKADQFQQPEPREYQQWDKALHDTDIVWLLDPAVLIEESTPLSVLNLVDVLHEVDSRDQQANKAN